MVLTGHCCIERFQVILAEESFACRVPEVGHLRRAAASRRSLVFVDQATKNWTAFDPFAAEVGNGVSRLGWAEAAGAVRSAAVVVPNVLGEHHTQVPLVENQQAEMSSLGRCARTVRQNSSPAGCEGDCCTGGRCRSGMLKLMRRVRRVRPVLPPSSAFTGFRFPREVIVLAVRWYLRYGLSYRDVEELLAERGVQVDHVIPRTPWPFAGCNHAPTASRAAGGPGKP